MLCLLSHLQKSAHLNVSIYVMRWKFANFLSKGAFLKWQRTWLRRSSMIKGVDCGTIFVLKQDKLALK